MLWPTCPSQAINLLQRAYASPVACTCSDCVKIIHTRVKIISSMHVKIIPPDLLASVWFLACGRCDQNVPESSRLVQIVNLSKRGLEVAHVGRRCSLCQNFALPRVSFFSLWPQDKKVRLMVMVPCRCCCWQENQKARKHHHHHCGATTYNNSSSSSSSRTTIGDTT